MKSGAKMLSSISARQLDMKTLLLTVLGLGRAHTGINIFKFLKLSLKLFAIFCVNDPFYSHFIHGHAVGVMVRFYSEFVILTVI